MSVLNAPTLRYWDCQGRAQVIRDFLIDREVTFNDEQVPGVSHSSEWPQLKADPTATGPFGSLPVLEWDGLVLGETPVIVRFLEQRFDLEPDLSEVTDLRAAMAASAAAEVSGWSGENVTNSNAVSNTDEAQAYQWGG